MAPVGSRESLAAAIHAGADSIYFGIESLNMRARSASTFTINDLREIARICDENGVKSYLTINTIIYDEDLELMRRIVDAAKEAGISAVIGTDASDCRCGQGSRYQRGDCRRCSGDGLLQSGGAGSTPFYPVEHQ